MTRKETSPPVWIRDGVAVLYRASPAPGWTFSGVVDGEPWLMGGHTWVVRLREMEPRYRNGERSTVPSAACDALTPAPATEEETVRRG